jgi:hypothetical protein
MDKQSNYFTIHYFKKLPVQKRVLTHSTDVTLTVARISFIYDPPGEYFKQEFQDLEVFCCNKKKKKTQWSEPASELYRPSDRRFSAKWLTAFADKGCHVVSETDPYGRTLGFLDRSRYFSIK